MSPHAAGPERSVILVAALVACLTAGEAPLAFTPKTAPREQAPDPTPQLVERLRAAPPLVSGVVRGPHGAPIFHIDGRPTSLLGGQQLGLGWGKDQLHIAPYRDGGIDLIMVSVNAGFQHADAGYDQRNWPSFWQGAGSYRPDVVEPELWRTLVVHPDAAILVRIWMTPYPAWTAEHPEAVMRNLRGHPLVVSTHYLRYDPKGPDPDPKRHEQLAGSFHSEALQRDMERTVEELVRTVESSVPGRRVAGYFIGGGQDGQLYDWGPPDGSLVNDAGNWGDFSPVAQAAWRRWLAERYRTPAALSAAWGRPVADINEAPFPAEADLVGSETLHHPVGGCIASDWNRFTADARLRLLSALARAAKRAATRPVVVGVPAGFSVRKDLSQAARLIREPAIDFLRHQIAYGSRLPNDAGGINAQLASHAANGKIFFADVDHPTWLVPDQQTSNIGVITMTSASNGRAAGPAELAAIWRRDHGMLASEGAGSLIHPILGGPWMYRDPAVVAEFNVLSRLYHGIQPGLQPVAEPAVAWVHDERSNARLKKGLTSVGHAWTRQQQNELLVSGAVFRAYYAEDLEDGLVPPARVLLMPNLLDLGPRLRSGLERFKQGGRTLVFGQATGWEQLARGDREGVAAATGIRLALAGSVPAVPRRMEGTLALESVEWAPAPAGAGSGAALLAATPAPVNGTWQPLESLERVDGAALMGVAPNPGRALHLRARVRVPAEQAVTVLLSADWWAEVSVDGVAVTALPRGAEAAVSRPVWGVLRLPAWGTLRLTPGEHLVQARLVSGSGGFRASIRLFTGSEPPAGQLQEWSEDSQAAVTVDDPRAIVLARYPSGRPALAMVDHGTWRAVFAGSWTLSSPLVGRLAREAGAWTPCPPDAAVVAAGNGVLMLHALRDGPLDLDLPWSAPLVPVDGGQVLPASVRHHLQLRRGESCLWWLNRP